MTLSRTTAAFVLPFLLLSACARPTVVQPITATDNSMPCDDVISGIQEAEKYRIAAREEDKFKWQYMLILPAIGSVYNINKAESAAIERKKGLMQIAKRKDCKITQPVRVQ